MPWQLARGGVADLPSNFLINNLLSVNTDAQSNVLPRCEKHQEDKLELYCNVCDQPICHACTEIDHQGHSYKFVAEAFPCEKKKVAKLVREAKPKISALKAEAAALEREEEKLRSNALIVSQEIDSLIDEHTALLEEKRQRLKQDLSDVTLVQMNKLREQKEALFLPLDNVEIAKQIIDSTDKVEFLRSRNEITSNLTELLAVAENFKPCEKVVFKLDRKTTVAKQKEEEIGKIISSGDYSLNMRGGEPGVLYTGRALQSCEFIINRNTSNIQALRLRNACDSFKVKIVEPNTNTTVFPLVENNVDGTHSFRYQPACSGIYKISVFSEKVFGGEIHGSPFSWNVSPALYPRCWLLWLLNFGIRDYTYLSDCLLESGQHTWRIKLLQLLEAERQQNYDHREIGVVHPLRRSTWCWKNGRHLATGHDPVDVPSPLKSLQFGDVFVVFLNLDKRQMIIYNERTKESDNWRGIEVPVTPDLYPDSFLFGPDFAVYKI